VSGQVAQPESRLSRGSCPGRGRWRQPRRPGSGPHLRDGRWDTFASRDH